MIVKKLTGLPKEDQLSDILVSVFKRNPPLIRLFTSCFAAVSISENRFDIYSRKQLSAIPGISAGSFGKLKPDIILSNQTHLLVFENKRDATLKSSQLPDYIKAVQGLKEQKSILYFLIAPRTSRYTDLPNEVRQVSWDQLYDFLLSNSHGDNEKELQTLGRFRLFFYQKIYDDVLSHVRSQFANLLYVSDKPTSDYYGVHFTLPQSSDVVFSLAIFLQSPSYVKLFPFKVKHQGSLFTFNDGCTVVKDYKSALLQIPDTRHELKSMYPGYVIDLFPQQANDLTAIQEEVLSLLRTQCPEMISVYCSLK